MGGVTLLEKTIQIYQNALGIMKETFRELLKKIELNITMT
jgi:hypothetical protein